MDAGAVASDSWPAVVGGTCSEDEAKALLNSLELGGMDVRIWTFTDHAAIGADDPPETFEFLERARLFGERGDLDLRREGDDFHWRYVGETDRAPEGERLAWSDLPDEPVYCREERALLWGEYQADAGAWFDDRTAGAKLTYPVDGHPDRVWVRYREYAQAGHALAVWLLGLEGDNG
jgi:hypothetical protein